MPYISVENDVYIDPEDFIDDCSVSDIKCIIDQLHCSGHLNDGFIIKDDYSYPEQEFLKSLNKIKTHYLSLDNNQIENIINLAKSL